MFLRSIGCEYVQGFYFAKPMPVEEYEKLIFGNKHSQKQVMTQEIEDTDNLWNSTSQMEILFSNMLQAVAVYEYDAESKAFDVLRVNDAYYDLFGHRDINAGRQEELHVIDKDGRAVLAEAFDQLVENKEMTECEFQRKLESGRIIWIQLKLKYISQVGNKHVIFGTLTDVTEQKAFDRELQKYRSRLQGKERRKTLLVVDDMELNRVSLRCIFEENYKVIEAENGKQALEILQKEGVVDAILLDLMMPVMDGMTFLEHKKNNPEIADIPVIMITADDTTKRQIETLKLGAEDYIVKPFVPELAIRRVEHVLKTQI